MTPLVTIGSGHTTAAATLAFAGHRLIAAIDTGGAEPDRAASHAEASVVWNRDR